MSLSERPKGSVGRRVSFGIQGILIGLILLVLLPILVSQAYFLYERYRYRKGVEFQQNLEMSRAVGRAFEVFVQNLWNQELAAGISLTLRDDLTVGRMNRILEETVVEYPMIQNFAWIGPQGRVIASTLPQAIGEDVSDRPGVREIISGRKDRSVGDLFASRITGKAVFNINRAIRNQEGSLRGVLGAVVEVERLDKVFAFERSRGGGIGILDRNGMLVYRHPAVQTAWEDPNWLRLYPSLIAEALAGRESVEVLVASGEKRVSAATPISSLGWVASAGRRHDEALGPILSAILQTGSAVLIIALASFATALVLARRIVISVTTIRNHALALGRGEAGQPVVASGPAELRDLARAFNKMAGEMRLREKALRDSEARLRRLYESGLVGILYWNMDGAVIDANDAFLEMVGYSRAELDAGKVRWEHLTPPEYRSLDERALTELRTTGKTSKPFEKEYIRKDGARVPIIIASATLGEARFDGVAVVLDISEQKRVEQELRNAEMHFRLLSDVAGRLLASDNPQALVDDLCRKVMEHLDCHTFFNFLVHERAGKLRLNAYAGIPEEESRRIEWLDFGVAVCGCVALEGSRIVAEDILHTPDGRTELVKSYGIQAYACHPLMVQGKLIGTLSFGTRSRAHFTPEELDLMKTVADQVATAMERMQLVEALRRSRDELELRVRERTAELESKNRELQEFAFVASHDLSEPLRKVQTFGSLLEAKSADRLDQEARDYVSRMTGAAGRMQELLDALLRYSRIETQEREFVPVKLDDLVRTVAADLEVSIRKIGAQVEIGPLPVIRCDPNQWRQLFQNLIANAVKYHRSEVKSVVKIHGSQTDGTARVLVEDNGIGFDVKYLDRIFQPFQRLHGRKEYPGTGIGLAICKKIVERHGGTITAVSTPGKGSTFIIEIPQEG